MTKRVQLDGANAARFYAALSIVLFHLLALTKIEIPPYLTFIKNYGGFGVPLFYVLSAFALSYGYNDKLQTTAEVRNFYSRRFFRIAPLFYVLLIAYPVYLWLSYGITFHLSKFLTSITFTFNLFPKHTDGIVPASWSIGVEMLFYAIFPFALVFVTNWRRAAGLLIVSMMVAAVWLHLFESKEMKHFAAFSLIANFRYFSAGILTYFIWKEVNWTPLRHRACIISAVTCMVLLISFSAVIVSFMARLGLTLGGAIYAFKELWIFVLSLLVAGLGFARFKSRILGLTAILGEASFSIYLWHPILIGILIRAGLYRSIASLTHDPLAIFLASVIATMALLLPISWLSFIFIEKRFGSAMRDYATGQRQRLKTITANPVTANQTMSG
jgi:peptidoglycan/LPS O-acetylase OafA/YrhL